MWDSMAGINLKSRLEYVSVDTVRIISLSFLFLFFPIFEAMQSLTLSISQIPVVEQSTSCRQGTASK